MLPNSLFGVVGQNPDPNIDDEAFQEMLRRIQQVTSMGAGDSKDTTAGDQNDLGALLPGTMIQNPAAKADKGSASAQNTPATAPSVDSRFLESNNGKSSAPDFNPSWPPFLQQQPQQQPSATKAGYQTFAPFQTTTEDVGPSDKQASTEGTVTDTAPSTVTGADAVQSGTGPMIAAQPPEYGPDGTPAKPPIPAMATPGPGGPNGAPGNQPPQAPTRVAQASTGTMNDADSSFSPSWQQRLGGFFYGLSGVRYDPYTNSPESRQAAYQALTEAGVSPATARAAIMNPKIMDQLVSTRLGAKAALQHVEIGRDMMGNPIPGTFNPITGDYRDAYGRALTPNNGPGSGAGGTGPIDEAMRAGVTGPEFLDVIKQADPSIANLVKKFGNYESAAPTGAALRNPRTLYLMSLAEQAFPGFSAQDYASRLALRKGFTAGKDADEVKSYDTVMGHLIQADKLIDTLGNTRSSLVNVPMNAIRNQYDEKYQANRAALLRKLDVAIGEVNKATALCSEMTRQNAPASGVPTGLPSYMIEVAP